MSLPQQSVVCSDYPEIILAFVSKQWSAIRPYPPPLLGLIQELRFGVSCLLTEDPLTPPERTLVVWVLGLL